MVMDVEMFTGETVRIFNRLKAVQFRDRMDINEENSAELTLLVLSMRYSTKPKYDIWEISLEIVEILSVSREFEIGIKKAIERIGKEEVISEESTKIISDENNSDDEIKERGSSESKEEIHEMEENGVITIYVNRKGIFNITETGKEFRIEIDENNDKKRLSGKEVIELCGSTAKDMNLVFKKIDELIRKLNEEQEKTTLLEELEDDIKNTQDEKRKMDKGKGKEILEDNFDKFENIINRSGFDLSKTSESEKESQESESESESEEEPLVINPEVDMALNIIRVNNRFNRENIDPEEWLQEFERVATANNWGDNVKVSLAAAHLEGAAAQWYEKDKELLNVNRGRINAWNDATDADTLARSFVTKFKEEFISEEAKEEKKREWFYQWGKIRQLSGENIDTYTKKFQKMVQNAERIITEKEKIVKYQEGLLPIYYANATVGNSANLTEAIRNARNSERGVLRQIFPNQNYEQTNKIYQELQKKDVKPEEIEDLTKMVKEMEIRLMKKFEGNNRYERRNKRYDNFDRKEVICYRCKEKGHYASDCENRKVREDIKCYFVKKQNTILGHVRKKSVRI